MKKVWIFYTLLMALLSACEIDHGLGTIDSEITGRIIFLNPEAKPDWIDAVRVAAVVHFPPQSLGDLVFTNTSINLSENSPAYRLPAPLANYMLVAAIYREKGKDWDYSNILGIYGADEINHWQIIPVILNKEHPIARNVDIYCEWPASK